jgi:DNA-binding Xre family transcriptional regulator
MCLDIASLAAYYHGNVFIISSMLCMHKECDVPRPQKVAGPPRPPSTVGERLLTLRNRRQLTQAELAKQAGISLQSIALLEQGVHRDLYGTTLRRLARALGCSVDELVGLDLQEHQIIEGMPQD